jgi:hypothetical protein
MVKRPQWGQDLLIIKALLSYTQLSVGILWMSDQPDEETFTLQYAHWQETDIHDPGWIRTPKFQQASGHPLEGAATGIGMGGLYEWLY